MRRTREGHARKSDAGHQACPAALSRSPARAGPFVSAPLLGEDPGNRPATSDIPFPSAHETTNPTPRAEVAGYRPASPGFA
ncbi:MAG: hypothetical protein K1X42_12895, partial [Opitutaceae bacterium]|nr:hypothetical protein [Opitutaceae bacterium]